MNSKEKSDIARKLKVLNHGLESKNVSKTCDILVFKEKLTTNGNVIMKITVKQH